MSSYDERGALAPNWRTILVVDAAIGVVAVIVGAVLAIVGSTFVGALLTAAGAVYLVFNVRRLRRWKRLRAEAGLT